MRRWFETLAVAAFALIGVAFGGPPADAQQQGAYHAQTTALASNLVVVTGPMHQLMTFEVNADSTLSGSAWWICIFDATAAPSNGAATPVKSYGLASGVTQAGATFDTDGPRFSTGIVIEVSTTTCTNVTASTHALFIAADYQ